MAASGQQAGGKALAHADELFDAGKFEKALDAYQHMLDSADPTKRTLLQIKKAHCLCRLERYRDLLDHIREMAEASDLGMTTPDDGKIWSLATLAAVSLGAYAEGKEYGLRAYELLRETDENRELATLLKRLGRIFTELGEVKHAKECYQDSLSTTRRIQDEKGIASAHNWLAQVCFVQSHYKEAVEHLKEALEFLEKSTSSNDRNDPTRERWNAALLQNLGVAYLFLDEWEQAREYLSAGHTIYSDWGTPSDRCMSLIQLSELSLTMREWAKAEEHLKQALNIAQTENLPRETAICYEYLGELAYEQGKLKEAEKYYRKALAIGEEIAPKGDIINQVHRRLAETLIAQGHNDRALASCEKALEVSLSLGNRLEKGIVYRVMGRAHAARNHNRLARQCYQQSIACLEEIVEERYEKAWSWFETGRFLCDIGEPGLAWGYLVRAQDIFSKLPAPYWEGVTHQEMARVRWKEGDFETALGLLDEAEEFFRDAGEEKALDGLQSLRREIEHSAISRSTEVRQEYEILEKFNRAMVTGEGEVESLLGLLLKRVGGSRGLVATQSDDGFKVVSTYNLDHRHAEQILEGLEHGISGYEAHQPVLSTRTAEDPRFSGIVDGHVESLMLVPFGVNHEIDGLVYVDRPSGYFGPREVSSLALFANVMALHVSYLRQQELVQENLRLRRQIEEESSFTSIVAHSRQMVEILSTIDRVRDSSIPILLEGETGTGKELLARAIHYSSDRSGKPFVVVNCAALPETLLESELFGHRRGAFTGATQDKPGLVEAADGGTFFLDEVSEMGGSAQAKLLRVLEQGEIQTLGAVGIRKVDIRLISATNKNLEKGVEEGWLRQDLFYRLKGVRICIPALRERREDIPLLVEHFLRREFGKKVPRVTPEVMRILMDYQWPGNVRELLNEVRRWAALAGGSRAITPDLLSESLTGGVPPTPDAVASEERSLTDRILAFERWCLAEALEKTGWVKTHAAKRLGIPEATLRLKMKRHGLSKRR